MVRESLVTCILPPCLQSCDRLASPASSMCSKQTLLHATTPWSASQTCVTLQASQDADAHGAQREAALAELARYEESGDGHLQPDSFWVSRTWLTCAPGHHPPPSDQLLRVAGVVVGTYHPPSDQLLRVTGVVVGTYHPPSDQLLRVAGVVVGTYHPPSDQLLRVAGVVVGTEHPPGLWS